MATFLLLRSGFPTKLPKEVCRVEAPDLDTALPRLGLLSGLGVANIARSAKEAMQSNRDLWVQSEASAMVESSSTPRRPTYPWNRK